MTKLRLLSLEPSTTFPARSLTVNVTAGFCTGFALSTPTIENTIPGNCCDRVATVCAPLTEASNSLSLLARWHCAQLLSDTCGKSTWPFPVAKFTSSWQAPHAAREGLVM